MTNQSIFGTQDPAVNQNTNTNSTDNNQNGTQDNSQSSQVFTFQEGEKVKEFKTPEDLFNGYVHSQNFIKTLKSEKEELAGKLQDLEASFQELISRQTSAEEILKKLKEGNTGTMTDNTNNAPVTFNQDAIVTAVTESLEAKARQQAELANLAEAESALDQVYGDKAREQVMKIAGENGMSFEEVKVLAMTKPKLFQNLFLPKSDNSSKTASVTMSSVNTKQLQQQSNTQEYRSFSQMTDGEVAEEMKRRKEELRKKYNLS